MSLTAKAKVPLWDSIIPTNNNNNPIPLGHQPTGHGLLALTRALDGSIHPQYPTR